MVSLSAFRVSSSGMSAERTRLDVIASNIANAESTRSQAGGPYARQIVQFAAVYDGVSGAGQASASMRPVGVKVVGVVKDPAPFRMQYDPGHPDADAQGYVSKPNVDVVTEMTDMISATRSYEANVTAFNAAKAMFQRALEIGS